MKSERKAWVVQVFRQKDTQKDGPPEWCDWWTDQVSFSPALVEKYLAAEKVFKRVRFLERIEVSVSAETEIFPEDIPALFNHPNYVPKENK